MAVEEYAPRAEYIGTGLLDEYTFDFKITDLTQLIIQVTDSSYTETFRVRGDGTDVLTGTDSSVIDSIDFDATVGGGTIFFTDVIASGSFLTILSANDAPVQLSEFKNKADFTLKRFEDALDYAMGAIQRLTYLVDRAPKISDDLIDTETFDTRIPIFSTDITAQNNVGKTIIVNDTNDGFDLSPFTQGWSSFDVNYNDTAIFVNATLAQTTLFNLPAGAALTGVFIKSKTAFAGTGVTGVTAQVGTGASLGQFISSYDVLAAVSDTNFDNISIQTLLSWASATALTITLSASGGGKFNAMTQGKFTVYYKYDVVAG